MSEMTTKQALEQVRRLIRLQKDAQEELKEQKSAKNYWFLDQCRNATDFAGIASLIERLQKMANFVGGSPSPVPWDRLQQKYLDEIERLQAENEGCHRRIRSLESSIGRSLLNSMSKREFSDGTDELRDAAERLQFTTDYRMCEYEDEDHDDPDMKAELKDMNLILSYVRKQIADRPEDDDDPVTEERLLLAGFEEHEPDLYVHPTGVVAVTNGNDWIVRVCLGGTRLYDPKWWQVRDLLRSLKGGE